jgi:proteasome beta subunit
MKRNDPISVKAASTLMANILSGQRYYPYWVGLLIGGWDREGGHVYSLDAVGGSIADKFVSVGSGSPFVYGVLEDYYKDGMTVTEGVDLAIRGITVAIKRDSASGDGIDVAVITQKDFKLLSEDEVKKRITKLKLDQD